MAGYGICPENNVSNPPSPPFSKGGMVGLLISCPFVPMNRHDDLSGLLPVVL